MDQSPVVVKDIDPPRCGRTGEKFYPDISMETLARKGVVFVRCSAGVESKIHSGEADGEPVTIHDCSHCRMHEFL
jgi:hypothetical protein